MSFWEQLMHLGNTNFELFQLIVDSAPTEGDGHRVLDSLVLVNSTARRLANKAYKSLALDIDNNLPNFELADVYPNATSLAVNLCESEDPTHVELFLDQVADCSPKLLSQIKRMSFSSECPYNHDVSQAAMQLLRSCTNLTSLNIQDASLSAIFIGQGSTADARRASLQAQLSALATSPEPLAHPTWPQHACLIALDFKPAPTIRSAPQILASAAATTSLVTLFTRSLTADHALDTFAQSPQPLPLLAAMDLTIRTWESLPATTRKLSQALGNMPTLQGFSVSCCADLEAPPQLDLQIFTQCTALNHLDLRTWHLDPRQLPTIKQIVQLDLYSCTGITSISDLFPLACLRELHVMGIEGDRHSEARGEAPGAPVPAGWRTGLKSLQWCVSDRCLDVVLPQLQGLEVLKLYDSEDLSLEPTLCRPLRTLTNLKHLTLPPANLGSAHTPPPPHLRPTLPHLATLDLDTDLSSLHFMARWTHAPSSVSITITDVREDVTLGMEPTGFSHGWLDSALRCCINGADETVYLVLPTDDAVRAYVDGIQRLGAAGDTEDELDGAAWPMMLGAEVSKHGLRRLVEAEGLRVLEVVDADDNCVEQDYVVGWESELILKAKHIEYLANKGVVSRVQEVRLCSCHTWKDETIAQFCSCFPEVREVRLDELEAVGAVGLWHLAARCGSLRVLELGGMSNDKVTPQVVGLLLATSRSLWTVEVFGMKLFGDRGGVEQMTGDLVRSMTSKWGAAQGGALGWKCNADGAQRLVFERRAEE